METRSPHTADEHIIHLLKDSRREGLSLLYDKYVSILYGVIYRILQQHEAAEEVLQDSFLKIWNNISQYDETKGKLASWMIRIARNTAIDRKRLKGFSADITQSTEALEAIADRGEGAGFNTDHIGIKELTLKLPAEHRRLIDLIYFEGYTQAEAADHLELPLGTVKTRVRAAIDKLRKLIS